MAASHHWKTALITGAASGIGRCFAETLAGQGTACGLIDVSADGLKDTAERLQARGARVETRIADVSDAAASAAAIEELASSLGPVDLVINCAAILGAGRFESQSAREFDRVISINLLGTANIVRASVPLLRKTGGAIACLASTAAVHGWPEMSAYSAAKFGVAGFCDAVRPELRLLGVGITAVFPLLIDTPLLRGADQAPILKGGRAIPPDEVVRKTLAGVVARKSRVYIPGTVRVIAAAQGLIPSVLDWYGARFGLKRS
jgi:3-oxoacyl-[acyl-carrier protein] reductase